MAWVRSSLKDGEGNVVTDYRKKPWWWTGSSPAVSRTWAIGWSVVALTGLVQVTLRGFAPSEPGVWLGAIQLVLGSLLAASGFRTLRALERGDTVRE